MLYQNEVTVLCIGIEGFSPFFVCGDGLKQALNTPLARLRGCQQW